MSVRTARTLGAVLIAASIGLGFALAVPLGVVLAAYAVLQASYNARLKRVILVDVIALATGFCLRAIAGGAAIEVPISIWLLLCVFFLPLFLGFVKRLCDLASARREATERGEDADGPGAWRSPAGYDDRLELNWLLAVSAVLTVTTYLMYALSAHARSLFGEKAVGFGLLVPFVSDQLAPLGLTTNLRLGRSMLVMLAAFDVYDDMDEILLAFTQLQDSCLCRIPSARVELTHHMPLDIHRSAPFLVRRCCRSRRLASMPPV